MSLSVGGFYPGYGHPGALGVSAPSHSDFYSQYPQQMRYPDYNERSYCHSWLLSQEMSPDTSPLYAGTHSNSPSPPSMTMSPNSASAAMYHTQTYGQPVDYVIGENGTLKPWEGIPISEMGNYEQYTNAFGERCYRRRTTANKKERKRTLSINAAFSNLRGSIPNVPSDTKLSKIKTLRLAISYISYLNDVLEKGDSKGGFKADISRKRERRPEVKVTDSACVSI